jgi:hypothetical protein
MLFHLTRQERKSLTVLLLLLVLGIDWAAGVFLNCISFAEDTVIALHGTGR